jgi:thioredoxin reductase (NADPH)
LIERSAGFGGQLHTVYNPIENYLGVRADSGRELLSHFLDSIKERPFERMVSSEVVGIDPRSMSVRLSADSTLAVRVIILATGVRRRQLGIPGEQEFQTRGILQSGARDGHLVRGKRVLIVGGGDAAFENAIILADHATDVKIAFRRSRPTARPEFVTAALERSNVSLLHETKLAEIAGNSTVESVTLESASSGSRSNEAIDAVLIRIGVEPNSELVAGEVELDDRGYVLVNDLGETSMRGVFAIGDVANPISPTISTAVGSGATAAKAAFDLVKTL